MFNLLLALITGLVIGWNFHDFFMRLTPKNILKNDSNISQLTKTKVVPLISTKKTTIQKPSIQKLPKKIIQEINISTPKSMDIQNSDTFNSLLHNNLFSDAMVLYIDANEVKLLFYQSILIQYFETEVKNNPQKAVEEMLEFQDIEPAERKVDMESFHEVDDNNNYLEKSQILFNLIKEEMNKNNEYTHEIPLTKLGEHFLIDVTINNQALTLLLDTGATLTMIDEAKLNSSLHVIKENIVLNTAGGKIGAKLQEAERFSIEDIELENFQIVSSSFKHNGADGLLGMNFFKKFKFKIDQEEAILYLSELEK